MKHLLILVLVTIIMFGSVQLAFTRTSETTGGSILDPYVDKNATGTKVFGPMTAHYEIVADPGDPVLDPDGNIVNPCDADADGFADDYYVKMTVSVRLSKGNGIYKYSSPKYGPVCYLDVNPQSALVYNWLNTSVLPGIMYPSGVKAWAVKSYSKIADCGWDPDNDCETPFTSVDIELAVK